MIKLLFLISTVLLQTLPDTKEIIKGKVVDVYDDPVPFAHIGIPGSIIGTISDEQGNFELSVKELTTGDTLYIYHLLDIYPRK